MKNTKNSIYGATNALVFPVLMLLATPVFLSYIGVEGYAIWVLINSVIGSLAVFNFGGGEIITKFISSIRGGNNKNSIGEVFSTVFVFQTFAILMIYMLFLIITPLIIPHISSENLLTFIGILYIAIPIFLLKQSEQLLYAFLRGHEQFGQVMFISSVSKVMFISVQIIIVIWSQSVADVFYGALIVSTLLFLLQTLYLKAIHKDNISFSKANIDTAKSLLSFGVWNWLSSLTSMIKADSDKWLVSGLIGLKTFGIYSIGVLVFNQLHTVVSSSIMWIFPNISKENSDKKHLAEKYWKLLFAVGTLSLLISFVLSNLGFVFELWLGKEFYQSSQYYIDTFLLIFPIFTMTIVPYFYLLGLGLVKHKFFADITSFVVKVATIWIVIDVFNIEEWVLFFTVFITVEYVAYSIVVSKNLPIKFIHLIVFLLLQAIIVLIRI